MYRTDEQRTADKVPDKTDVLKEHDESLRKTAQKLINYGGDCSRASQLYTAVENADDREKALLKQIENAVRGLKEMPDSLDSLGEIKQTLLETADTLTASMSREGQSVDSWFKQVFTESELDEQKSFGELLEASRRTDERIEELHFEGYAAQKFSTKK